MNTFTPPPAMTRLLDTALTHQRSCRIIHNEDSAGSPFVTITIRWPGIPDYQPNEVTATWHTRNTGTYRLMHASAAWARCDHTQISLTKATQFVAGEWVPQEVADLLEEAARRDDPAHRGMTTVNLH